MGYWLYQKASESLTDEDNAFGQIYRIQGSWNLLGRDTGHPGEIQYRFEYRSGVGSYLAPSELSDEIGIAALTTGFAYTPNFDFDLAVINWTQMLNNERAGVAIGRLAYDSYLDSFAFQTFSRGFINKSFVGNPTLAAPGIGALGVVARGFVIDQLWIGGQVYDANAVSGEFDMDTFNEGEWLKAVEIGITPGFHRHKSDLVQFTYWDKDARQQAGTSPGKGWLVSASWKLDKFFPFLRLGHSDGGAGALATDAASVGLEYTVRPDQAWSLGFGWARPTRKSTQIVRDEYVFETSYKFQFLRSVSILADVQFLRNPANNLDQDSVTVVGLRGILTL
jgi:hypothetical protein